MFTAVSYSRKRTKNLKLAFDIKHLVLSIKFKTAKLFSSIKTQQNKRIGLYYLSYARISSKHLLILLF